MAETTAPRQGRRIADQEEGEQPVQSPESKGKTVTFIKNQVNEVLVFDDGTTHRFRKSKETYDDPKLIKNIRSVAAKHGVLEA